MGQAHTPPQLLADDTEFEASQRDEALHALHDLLEQLPPDALLRADGMAALIGRVIG